MKKILLLLSLTLMLSLTIAGCENKNVDDTNLIKDNEELDRSLDNDIYFEALKLEYKTYWEKSDDDNIKNMISEVEEKITSQYNYEDEDYAKFLITGLYIFSNRYDGNNHQFVNKVAKEISLSKDPIVLYEELIDFNGKYRDRLLVVKSMLDTVLYNK